MSVCLTVVLREMNSCPADMDHALDMGLHVRVSALRDTLGRSEHGGVQQSSLKAPASPRRQVGRVIPVLRFAVPSGPGPPRHDHGGVVRVALDGLVVGTAVGATVVMPGPVAVVRLAAVAVVAVCSTVYLEDDGAERDEKADADAAKKHQRCPLGLV